MAQAALDELRLEKLLFMPTGAPHYREPAVADYVAAHRLYSAATHGAAH